jgi:hypothetical protein
MLALVEVMLAHHGPGMRGFNSSQPLTIKGVLTKCFGCSNGARGDAYILVRVNSEIWEATLPDTPVLNTRKVDLGKLKTGITIIVTGFASIDPKSKRIYANEIMSNGVELVWLDTPVSAR